MITTMTLLDNLLNNNYTYSKNWQDSNFSVFANEDNSAVVLQALVPGRTKKDISISITSSYVLIEAPEHQLGEGFAFPEIKKNYRLPNTLDGGAARGKVADGVLTLTIPMKEQDKPHKIKIT